MQENRYKPPSLANWLMYKLIKGRLHEEFFGDLQEIYRERVLTKGKIYASLLHWVDVLHLLLGFTSFGLLINQNNRGAMYKHYLHISGRNLLRNKVYSIINVLGLAVGMGVCLTISQYVYFEWSFDRFHDNVQNTYRMINHKTQNGIVQARAGTYYGIGPEAIETIPEIRQYTRICAGGDRIVTNPDTNAPFTEDELYMLYADSTFLQVFNFPLKMGSRESLFTEKFNIVITEKVALKFFGANNPIGKTLEIRSENFTVSGVIMEPPDNSHLQFDILLPMANVSMHKNGTGWEWDNWVTYYILDEFADINVVQSKLDQLILQHLGERHAQENLVENVKLQPLADIHLKSSNDLVDLAERRANKGNIQNVEFFSLMAIFVLLIAWANYINLSTARSIHRAKEIGVRKSIGAFRRQLIDQFMLESLLINLLAAILAIGIAALALPVLSHLIGRELPFGFLRVPGFWIGFSVVILLGSLLSGLYPAFVLSSFKPVSMLGAHKNSRLGKINLRRGLIVFQFLTSLLLISGTYLVYKQIMFMKHKELGIDMEKILVLQGPKNLDMVTFDAFRTEVARHHSIAAVTGSQRVPGRGISGDGGFRILGKPESANQYGRMISTGFYFPETYDLEFLAGGSFSQNMSTEDRPVIINEEAALTFGFRSPEDAIQETLVNAHRDKLYTYRVVGVVKNFHWHSLRDAHTPYLFRFMPQDYYKFAVKHISLKMSLSNIQESLAHIEKTYKSFFPGNTFNYFFLDDDFNNQYRADLQFGKVFLSFTVLAILIACIGLLALVSYSATLRIKEFGIRKVFGAGIGNIMMLLSREYVVLLLIATILAIPAIIYWGSSWLENYAFRTTIGFDLFIIPTLTLLLISFLTVSHRTYAAAKANPVDSLRTE